MSMNGAGPCGICGAWSDYCTLETAAGPSVDCRDLMLRPSVKPIHAAGRNTATSDEPYSEQVET